jgi:hypothetical protein
LKPFTACVTKQVRGRGRLLRLPKAKNINKGEVNKATLEKTDKFFTSRVNKIRCQNGYWVTTKTGGKLY